MGRIYGSSRSDARGRTEKSVLFFDVEETTVGSRLRIFAKARYRTLTAFAEVIGITVSQVSDWANDRNAPTATALMKFAGAGLNVHWLLTGEGDMMANPPRSASETDHEGEQTGSGTPGTEHPAGVDPDDLEMWRVNITKKLNTIEEFAAMIRRQIEEKSEESGDKG